MVDVGNDAEVSKSFNWDCSDSLLEIGLDSDSLSATKGGGCKATYGFVRKIGMTSESIPSPRQRSEASLHESVMIERTKIMMHCRLRCTFSSKSFFSF